MGSNVTSNADLSAHINTNAFLSAIHLIIGSVAHALYLPGFPRCACSAYELRYFNIAEDAEEEE